MNEKKPYLSNYNDNSFSFSNIYVLAPANYVSGGPETMHQIASIVENESKSNVYMVYVFNDKIVVSSIPKKFSHYNLRTTNLLIDEPTSLVIGSETTTKVMSQFTKAKHLCCWLSWDFFFLFKATFRSRIDYSFLWRLNYFLLKFVLLVKHRFSVSKTNFKTISSWYNTYNCEYIKYNLLKRKIVPIGKICGPISTDFFDNILIADKFRRKNIVVYNPAKGKEAYKRLFRYCKYKKDTTIFIPITGLSNKEVINLLMSAKVYLDLGYFPGPERLPRQAALLGCLIITSNIGAASNDIDVPIPKEFKIGVFHLNCKKLLRLIKNLFDNYDTLKYETESYIYKVKLQQKNFCQDVCNVLKSIERKEK